MKEYILLIPNNIKKEIIKTVRKRYYNYNIKFMSLSEFLKKYTFDYDNKTIYYLMKKENVNYDTASIYLENLYYIDDKLNNKKMQKLKDIKSYLDDNNLLIYSGYFKDYVQNKEICIYGYDNLNKYEQKKLSDLNYKVIEKNYKNYPLEYIYIAKNIDDEVLFVVSKIISLLKEKIDLKNIKLICTEEYKEILKRIFKIINIPINIKEGSIYSIYECKELLNNIDNIEEYLNKMSNRDIKNKLIRVLNNYSFIDDKKEVKELIIKDLKNTYLDNNIEGIDIISLNDYIDEDDYVFLMGFCKEHYPLIHKDNEYFSDKEKKILDLDTSNELNIREKDNIIKRIQNIKNLIISYKEYDSNSIYTKSNLFENLKEVNIENSNFNYSNMLNKILLTEKLDDLVKYNIKNNDLDLLYNNYDIPYMEYDNCFNKIDKEKLYKYLDNKLVLSYTSFDDYNKCKFKYYLKHVLKLNVIKDDFAIIIGNICHYVLSCMDKDDFNILKYFDNYVSTLRELTNKEKFFISLIREEISFIVDTIKKQLTYSSLDQKMYEEKVYVNMDKEIKVTFMGVIDKVLYKDEEDKTYLVVIDYKTGSTDIKLDNLEYGIGLQLPIYLYLSSKMKLKNIKVAGFYLQKLLNTNLDNTKDYLTAKENTLKLEGYSIDNESVLSKFDQTYNDSKLIKSMKTSANGFYKYSKVLSEEEIDNLINKTDKLINNVVDNILSSDFEINPKIIEGDNVGCQFCEYRDICYRQEKDLVYLNRNNE